MFTVVRHTTPSTTNAEKIHLYANCARSVGENVIIFTTYHSLHRVMESDIEVNTIYFDEAHNSVQRNFFPATEFFSGDADRCYFYTATPKHSLTVFKPGMNDSEVYGQVICNVPAPQLVDEGYILPPKVVIKELPTGDDRLTDCQNLLETIDDNSLSQNPDCCSFYQTDCQSDQQLHVLHGHLSTWLFLDGDYIQDRCNHRRTEG